MTNSVRIYILVFIIIGLCAKIQVIFALHKHTFMDTYETRILRENKLI